MNKLLLLGLVCLFPLLLHFLISLLNCFRLTFFCRQRAGKGHREEGPWGSALWVWRADPSKRDLQPGPEEFKVAEHFLHTILAFPGSGPKERVCTLTYSIAELSILAACDSHLGRFKITDAWIPASDVSGLQYCWIMGWFSSFSNE